MPINAALLQVIVMLHVDQCILPDAKLGFCNVTQQNAPNRDLRKLQWFWACKAFDDR